MAVCDIVNKLRSACVAEVWSTSQSDLFLLFIGKEWTNIAAPREAKNIEAKKVLLVHEYWQNHHIKPAMEMFAHFLCF